MKKYVQIKDKHMALNDAIDKALTAPFQQIAIHHLIDRLFEYYEPDPDNLELLRLKVRLTEDQNPLDSLAGQSISLSKTNSNEV